jgi:general stress protein 26
MDKTFTKRIREELASVGIKSKALLSSESKALARIIYDDEHIGGAVHGVYSGGLAWLVATDKRIIFMDRKPMFSSIDEVSYDVVSGTKNINTALSESVTLHTRMGDYTVNYVRQESAVTFIRFIEKMRLGYAEKEVSSIPASDITNPDESNSNDESINFLRNHDIGVLSTIDRTGNIHGAVVNYLIDQYNNIYILTKSGTAKGRNIFASSKVALTVYEADKLQTAQLQGDAEVETNQAIKDAVHTKLTKPKKIKDEMKLPPVTKLKDGEFMIIKIKPTEIKYRDYSK